jgi:hypothetical protein
VVGHDCNLSYLGDGDWEYGSSRTVQAKSQKDPISTHKLDMEAFFFNPSHTGDIGRRIVV